MGVAISLGSKEIMEITDNDLLFLKDSFDEDTLLEDLEVRIKNFTKEIINHARQRIIDTYAPGIKSKMEFIPSSDDALAILITQESEYKNFKAREMQLKGL